MDGETRGLIDTQLRDARRSIQATASLMKDGLYDDAASRAYYAALHACRAVFLAYGYSAKSHSGVASVFSKEFVKPGVIEREYQVLFQRLRESREVGDYGVDDEISADQATERLKDAGAFTRMERLLAEMD